MGSNRTCLFCSNRANSLEDAWPLWITNQFKTNEAAEFQAERRGVALKPWRVYQPRLTLRCVCQPCNNGWMSKLENQAKPFLQPLLTGNRCLLDIAGQSTVALWSVKTAMVLEGQDALEQRLYMQPEREQLRKWSALPWRTWVWLAASADPTYFMSAKNRHMEAGNDGNISGVSITMMFAHVVLQVLTIRVPNDVGPSTRITMDIRKGRWPEATVQIWPTQSRAVWPPPMGLNGESGLNLFAERFSTTSVGEDEIESLEI